MGRDTAQTAGLSVTIVFDAAGTKYLGQNYDALFGDNASIDDLATLQLAFGGADYIQLIDDGALPSDYFTL